MLRFPTTANDEFMGFAQQIDQLNLAVDLLVWCGKARSWSQVMEYCRSHDIAMAQSSAAVSFLLRQRLLTRKEKAAPRDYYGHRDSVYKAIPKAVEELIYRLAHDGTPSPAATPPDPYAAQRIARDKVNKALHAAGFRGSNKSNRRLRVV